MKLAMLLMAVTTACLAQAQDGDGDKLVTVPKRYVSSEGLAHEAPAAASQWIGLGREIGIATKEGLDAVVTEADKFGTTRVGGFVLFMIAWKIAGHDLIRVGLGIPLCLTLLSVWACSMRYFFLGAKRVTSQDGKVKQFTYERYKFNDSDGRVGCAVTHALGAGIIVLMLAVIIFA